MLPKNATALTVLLAALAALAAAPGSQGQHISIQRHGGPVAVIEQMLDMGLPDLFQDDFVSGGIHVGTSRTNTLLSVGCTPVRTLHKQVSRGENETALSLHVSQTCPEGRAPMASPEVTLEAGAVVVSAEGLPPQRFPLDPRADTDAIAATYNQSAATLTVTIPIRRPDPRPIPVRTIPSPTPDAAAPARVAGGADGSEDRDEEARREEYVRASVETLERELERIKGHIASPSAPPAPPRSPVEQ